MQPNPSSIGGLKFFDSNVHCLQNFKASWGKRVVSFIKSFGTLFTYGMHKISLIFSGAEEGMKSYTRTAKAFQSDRLVVCLHGLNNNPTQFKEIIEELKKTNLSKTDIFIPYIKDKGNAKLDSMVQLIFSKIQEWSKKPGDKELVLVGVSNGGRIAKALDAEISKFNNEGNIKKIKVISIVGAWNGSSLVNLANKLGLSFLMSKPISEEMPVGSDRNKTLECGWKNGIIQDKTRTMMRDYTFIGSPHDWQVTNYTSSLPMALDSNCRYAIVPGHGHNSIVRASAKAVAEIIKTSI